MARDHDLHAQFLKLYGDTGARVHQVRAPGRVNLIGEHTDYNDGFVFPMAIEPEVRIAFRPRDDMRVRLASTAFAGEFAEFSIEGHVGRGEPSWSNYSRGVAAEMLQAGIPLTGFDGLITNTLPVGGGLSSSAALEVATACCFLALGGLDIDTSRLALICQKAEHEYALVPCGIMDQTAVISSRRNHAMLLDCRDLSRQYIPLDSNELRVVIINSMVKHELSGGEYAERRRQCEEAVAFFKPANPAIRALRDVHLKQLEESKPQLDPIVYQRAHHVITENHRATEAARYLAHRDYEKAGRLMGESHASLRDDYNVSIPELDFLAAEAMTVKGVYGARMTGGGFGGCVVALTQPRAVEPLIEHVTRAYRERFNLTPHIFPTTATAGAGMAE